MYSYLDSMSVYAFFQVSVALFAIIIVYFKWKYQYWKRRNMPYLTPSIPFGNSDNIFKREKAMGVEMKDIYEKIRSLKLKHCGIYLLTSPSYVVADLDYLKNILTKDFQYFTERGFYYNEKADPLSAHLFALGGTKWKNLRTKLTPTFTSSKMKAMYQSLLECETVLSKVMNDQYEKKAPIDIKEILGRFSTDIIGSCAFGLDCNTFKDDDSSFRIYGKQAVRPSWRRSTLISIGMILPRVGQFFGIRFLDKEVSDFFIGVVEDNINYRRTRGFVRNDFMQILIDLQNENDGNFTMNELAAQCFVFFLAGFETSSSTMTFALYELAKNSDIQEKLRDEINSILKKYDGNITYDGLNDMKYMTQVLNETLRKYPPLPMITRECVKEYKVPDADVIIEKGTRITIPIMGIHYDPEYYEKPEIFDPERFNDENKSLRDPYSHIPFGEGPRICIGMRFGMMQSKVGLTSILRKYRIKVNSRTNEPLEFSKSSFPLSVEGDIWLDIEKI